MMTEQDMAEGLFTQAESSIEAARKALEDGHWAFAVRSSQDASELSLKALLLSAGADPPKVHDLGHAMKEHKRDLRRLGLDENGVEFLAKTAGSLAEDRSRALYGDERRDIPAVDIYGESDARKALDAAESIRAACAEATSRRKESPPPH